MKAIFEKAKNYLNQGNRSILFILLVGLILRITFTFFIGNQISQPDEGGYLSQAKYLYQHGLSGYWTMPTDRPPGVGLFILLSFALFGTNVLKTKLFFALIGSTSIYFVYRYALDLFNKKTAICAALIAALYPFFIYWSSVLMTENLSVFLIAPALFFTNRLITNKGNRFSAAVFGGLSWTMLIMIRAQNFYFLPFLFGIFIWKKAYKGRLVAAFLFFFTAISMPFMWMCKNYKNSGSFALDTHGGVTLLINTAFHNESRISWGFAMETLQNSKTFKEAKKLPPEKKDLFYKTKAIDFILSHQMDFIKTRAYNFIQFWRFYPRIHIPNQDASPFLNTKKIYFVFISLLTEPFIIPLGIFGFFLAFKEKSPAVLLPFSFIAFTALIHTLIVAQMRYRLSIMPILIIFSVYGALKIYRNFKRENWS